MNYEFDPEKDRENRRKHGLSLILGREIIENMLYEELDQESSFEERWIAYGFALGRLMVCVYTMRGPTHRIISVRRATRREEQRWLP